MCETPCPGRQPAITVEVMRAIAAGSLDSRASFTPF